MSLANEESRALPRNKDNGAGKLYFVKGLKKADEMPEILRGIDRDATLCVETHSLEGFKALRKVRHISEFGPEHGEESSREAGRDWVAQLTESVLHCTGKPAWQSFEYRGISAWWFLEIIFQEPSYLVARRQQALAKAVSSIGKGMPRAPRVSLESHLPMVPVPPPLPVPLGPRARLKQKLAARRERLKAWRNQKLRRLAQLRFLARLRRSEVLCLIEHENLRRHADLRDGSIRAVLPYAEGVIEGLRAALGDRCTVLPRRPPNAVFEGWEFLGPALPPLIYKPLPPGFEAALNEVAMLALPVIRDYFTPATLKEVMVFRLAEYDFYLDLLERVKPKAIFAYNWEGVFRPLVTAARVKGCRVVGVQQALGPYLHALDHRETGYIGPNNPQGFAIPTKVALWGAIHRHEFLEYGYPPDSIAVPGYARLDNHFHVKDNKRRIRERACAQLGLDPNERYLLFTGQSRVLDTIILRAEHFTGALRLLCRLANEFGFRIIMKPWTSDDMSMVERAAHANPGVVYVAPQNVLVANADLLAVSDWLVGTFSSIVGEATLAGNACVLLNYPESRYYFDLPHVEHYRAMIPFVDRPEDMESVLRPLLESEPARTAVVDRAQAAMHDIFGPCDGKAAERIVNLVLAEAGVGPHA